MLANLINESFFQVRADWLLWVFAAFAIVLLVFGADKLVTAAVKLASAIGMSKVLIGATVVSLGTTMPEACVSVMAAFGGKPGLALGNGVGSIICDTALIFGLSCMITRLPLNRFVLYRHGVLKLVTCTLLTLVIIGLAFLAGGIDNVSMPRLVGIVFIILLAVYMYLSVRWAMEHPELIPEEAVTEGSSWRLPAKALLHASKINEAISGGVTLRLAERSGSMIEIHYTIKAKLGDMKSKRRGEIEGQGKLRLDLEGGLVHHAQTTIRYLLFVQIAGEAQQLEVTNTMRMSPMP